ncbi:MAG TPA: hypothetical protein DCG16_05395 [Gemmatimonadetes bacterium]|nr:hypothetical protein [Gemmatimonadota bacterium]
MDLGAQGVTMRRSPMRIKKYGCVGFLALVGALGAGPVRACAQDVPAARLDSLRTELEVLRARLDSLEGVVVGGQAEDTTDAIARLRSAAQAAAGDAAADTVARGSQDFVGRARSLQALNPEISLNGDLYGSIHSDNPRSENFIPREFEFSFVSALDPYARAKIFLAVEEHGGGIEVFPGDLEEEETHGAHVGVEEGYVEWVALPGGLRLKGGRFFQQFGQLNRWHSHALHFQSRSLPHLAFIGEGALAQDGASVHWLLPTGGSGAYEATLELTRSRNEVLFGEAHTLSYLGHMNAFWQLSPSTDLELGLSALFGDYQDVDGRYDNRLFGAEMAFNWAPPQQSLYRGIVMRGGVMLSDPEAVRGLRGESAWGIWSLAEIKLSQQWVAGGRYDWVENPEDPSESAWLASPTLTYWQSEYVRLRAEYDILGNPGKTTRQFTLRITFAMGPHKHETY